MRAQHYANRLEGMVEDRTQEVLETNERFEAFMNIAPFRFAIYSPDDVLLEINDEGLRAFGPEVKREGVVGKSSLEIQPGIEKTKRYRIAHEVLQTGIPRYIEEDAALPQFGGISFSLWLFKVGPNIGSILLNITERKKMENSLRKSEETLRGFMDSSDEGYSIYDSELRLLELNGTALRRLPKGTKKENLIGKRIAEIYPGIESTQWYPVYLEVLRSGRTYHGEGRSVAIQGGLWLSASIFKVGEGLGVISRDISERKVLEERLHRAEVISAVEQMGATVAHDLRGPLGQVVQAVNMIKQDPNLTPRMLQIVEENAVRSLRMISDWRSSTRQILPQPIKTNFSDLVQHVLEGMTIPWNVEVARARATRSKSMYLNG